MSTPSSAPATPATPATPISPISPISPEPEPGPFVHHLADCQSGAIGPGSKVWQFTVVLAGARIGANCNINSHCFIENDVVLGDNVTVKCGNYLWDGLTLEDNTFVGPNVTFANDRFPRSKQYPEAFARTVVKAGASIGAAAVILPGITIGEGAMVGAGAVVAKDVPAHSVVRGDYARHVSLVQERPVQE